MPAACLSLGLLLLPGAKPGVSFNYRMLPDMKVRRSPNPRVRARVRLPQMVSAEVFMEEAQKSAMNAQRAAADKAEGAYSWSMSQIRASQSAALDAYSWSLEATFKATAAMSAVVRGPQYAALLPRWFTKLGSRNIAEGEEASVESPSNDGVYALALSITSILESIGPLSVAIMASYIAMRCSLPTIGEPFLASLPEDPLLAFLITLEAVFYLICCLVATNSNRNLDVNGPPPWSSAEDRREIWQRMIRDPSQSPRDFVESFMYRDSEALQPSSAELIFKSMAQQLGFRSEVENQVSTAPDGRALVEAYSVPWEELSLGDVYAWLCRALYSKQQCSDLTQEEDQELREVVDELEDAVGSKLVRRSKSRGISSMVGHADPLRWRHRPLFFYGLTHGIFAGLVAPALMQNNGFVRRTQGKLLYWHRPGIRKAGDTPPDAFVFVHGIGFGPIVYVDRVLKMCADDVDILMIELPAISQRVFPSMPPIPEFGTLVTDALDALGLQRYIAAGHSFGSAYANYLQQHDARTGGRRLGGVVLLDPIAVNLHHARTTREVVYTRLENAQASFEDFMFKKELWTSLSVSRTVPWHLASFWLEQCEVRTPTLIAVGTGDLIVSAGGIIRGFGSWQARLRGVRVLSMPENSHGEWLFDDNSGKQLVSAVQALRSEAASIGAAEAALLASANLLEVRSKASASFAAATEPLTDALSPALVSVADAYEQAVVEAETARSSLEDGFARAATESQRSFEAFERELLESCGLTEESLRDSSIQRRLDEVRVAMKQDFEKAASVVQKSWSGKAQVYWGQISRVSAEAAGEAKRGPNSVKGKLASAASAAVSKAQESLNRFERELAGGVEAATAAALQAERARTVLVREAAKTIDSVRTNLKPKDDVLTGKEKD